MIFDAHGDILTDIELKSREGKDSFKDYHLSLYKEGQIGASIFVNFTDPNSQSQDKDFEDITKVAVEYMKKCEEVHIVKDSTDFVDDKINVILGIEGAKPIKSVSQLEQLYQVGYRHVGLTWNEENQFAGGAHSDGNLTELGEELIKWTNENGMIVDFAHLNYRSFVNAASVTSKPIFFSHGNVTGLCYNRRNLDDRQLELVKESNGVIGVCAIKGFLTTNAEATIDDFVNHILYVREKIGIDHVGLGLDFCHYLGDYGSNSVEGLEGIEKSVNISTKLLDAGLSQEEVDKVLYLNMKRVVDIHLSK